MEPIYCKLSDPAVALLLSKTFPGLRLQQCGVNVHQRGGMPLTSCWSGGSKEYHKIVRLSDMAVFDVPENGSGFTQVDRTFGPAGLPVEMPAPGFAVVTHSTGCYKALSIHLHAENAAKMLPAPVEMTWAEKVVLTATRSLKSSYAGIKEYRYHEAHSDTGITRPDWDTAKAALIGRGLLNAAGAITIEGRNAAGSGSLWNLKQEASNAA